MGFGGTNAHLILEEAPILEVVESSRERPLHLLTLSAQTQVTLKKLCQEYLNFLGSNSDINLADLSYTVNTGRAKFNHNLAVVTQSSQQLQAQLQEFIDNNAAQGLINYSSRSIG